ncbi:hypothetical protein CYMTET_28343 [Cymbomonas tetramitiformis]|uniref:Condensin-2 complex subunit H2 n=1 Tax=Cymbomonas tetramitiformis TaxID=36881 RepID=A0AAE0FN07_9CHLO|nr:hypothetical protein CYMTET_28343 [Cymbomonas tetramitiformis]
MATLVSDGEAVQNRFQHLKAPLKDLVANWNVDIASDLDDYLNILENITFSFEGGEFESSLNFAEAALLIQGSTCIYSKKVELLHKLVYQALDFISDKKRKEKSGEGNEEGEEIERNCQEEIESFLNAEFDLDEAKNIDLDETTRPLVKLVPRPPAALIALEEAGGTDGCENYKINGCIIHHSGALLLEHLDNVDELIPEDLPEDAPPSAPTGIVEAPSAQGLRQETENSEDMGGPGPCPIDEDAHDHFDDGAPDFGDDELPDSSGEATQAYDPTATPEPVPLPVNEALEAIPEEGDGEEEFDAFEPLDPHDVGDAVVKPFKKGRTFRSGPRQRSGSAAVDPTRIPKASLRGATFPDLAGALAAIYRAQEHQARAVEDDFIVDAPEEQDAFSKEGHDALVDTEGSWSEDEAALDGFHSDEDFSDGGGQWDGDDERLASPLRPCTLAEGDDWEGEVDKLPMSYEDLCRAHVDSLVAAAAAAEIQTELASRVSVWKSKIDPQLELENLRPVFDIHEYGRRMIDKAGNPNLSLDQLGVNGIAAFSSLMTGEAKHTVSRLFAAMLQLVNDGNLGIAKPAWDAALCTAMECYGDFDVTVLKLGSRHTQFGDDDAVLGGMAAGGVDLKGSLDTQPVDGTAGSPALLKAEPARETAKGKKAATKTSKREKEKVAREAAQQEKQEKRAVKQRKKEIGLSSQPTQSFVAAA